jgi:hypothetical protein
MPVKKFIIFLSISAGVLITGSLIFAVKKAKQWAKLFGMGYKEFSNAFGIGVMMLETGASYSEIERRTGINFLHPDILKYFPSKRTPFFSDSEADYFFQNRPGYDEEDFANFKNEVEDAGEDTDEE